MQPSKLVIAIWLLATAVFANPSYMHRHHERHGYFHLAKRGSSTHTVVSGDTGSSVSAEYSITFSTLSSFNPGVDWNNLQIGQALQMPSQRAPIVYQVVSGDTGTTIASNYSILFADLSAANPNVNWNDLQIGQSLNVPGYGTGTTCLVASGDTGATVAASYEISFDSLSGANPSVNWNSLQIGQVLQVPAGASPSLSSTPMPTPSTSTTTSVSSTSSTTSLTTTSKTTSTTKSTTKSTSSSSTTKATSLTSSSSSISALSSASSSTSSSLVVLTSTSALSSPTSTSSSTKPSSGSSTTSKSSSPSTTKYASTSNSTDSSKTTTSSKTSSSISSTISSSPSISSAISASSSSSSSSSTISSVSSSTTTTKTSSSTSSKTTITKKSTASTSNTSTTTNSFSSASPTTTKSSSSSSSVSVTTTTKSSSTTTTVSPPSTASSTASTTSTTKSATEPAVTYTGYVAGSNAVTSINNSDGVGSLPDSYTFYSGNGSVAAGWPATTSWTSFANMWNANLPYVGTSCSFSSGSAAPNSATETQQIYDAIQAVAAKSYLDHRMILAVIMQESRGCVRVPTTSSTGTGAHANPGLMQSHAGAGTCNFNTGNGTVLNPCPVGQIFQMIEDGVFGTSTGDGYVQGMNYGAGGGGYNGSMAFYRAARYYNSGSVPSDGDLGGPGATRCYSSDIANRLMGWVTAQSKCTLDSS